MKQRPGRRWLWLAALVAPVTLYGPVRVAAQEPGVLRGDIKGRVFEQATGEPLPGAVVYVVDTELTGMTDEDGRFAFLGMPEGAWTLSVFHPRFRQMGLTEPPEGLVLVYPDQETPVEFRIVEAPDLGAEGNPMRLQAIHVVTSRPDRPEVDREGGVSSVIERDEIEEMEVTAQSVGDLLNTVPGLKVRDLGGDLCVQSTRSLTTVSSAADVCPRRVAVVLDGIRVFDPGPYLAGIRPHDIDRVEFLSAVLAGYRYGTGTSNGVLVIHTRTR